MDLLEIKRQYEGLSDDEIMRLWADRDGLTEIASSVLSEEITRRKLGGPEFDTRVWELKQQLGENKARFERHQKRIMWRTITFFAAIVISVLASLIKLFIGK
jgi:hypothetical protein